MPPPALPPDSDPLRTALQAWQPSITPRADLADAVLARVRPVRRRNATTMWRWLPRLAGAAALVALGATAGFWQSQERAERYAEDRAAWLLGIDPVQRAAAPPDLASATPAPFERLDWMRREFDLSAEQFRRLGRLQSRFAPEFEGLYRELDEMESAYAAFDALRRGGEMVDFIALYELLQEREALRSTAQEVSAGFLAEFFAVLQPAQQSAFHRFLTRSAPDLATAAPPQSDA